MNRNLRFDSFILSFILSENVMQRPLQLRGQFLDPNASGEIQVKLYLSKDPRNETLTNTQIKKIK